MAITKCVKCGMGFFEVVENSPRGSEYKLMIVQCSSCGTPIGTMDFYAVGTNLTGLIKRFAALEKSVKSIDENIRILDHNIKVIIGNRR